MLPKIPPKLVKPVLAASFWKSSGEFAFNRYLGIAPPQFARVATGGRGSRRDSVAV
jgi:hypothetical protein